MSKQSFKPGCIEAPLPVVMVSCGEGNSKNIITIAWTGIVNSEPPMTYISVRPERHSYNIIKETGEFVINLVNENLTKACDYCGVKSGAKVNKWKEMNLTPGHAEKVKAPIIEESPVNLECRVVESREYPTHTMFVAEIVNMQVSSDIIDEKGRIGLDNAGLIAYCHGEYLPLRKHALGTFGFSVMKKSTKRRKATEKKNSKKNKER